MYFNGSTCVVEVIYYEVKEEKEIIYINLTSNETTTVTVNMTS